MNQDHRKLLNGIYAITDASITNPTITLHHVEQVLKGGARIIQFRDKSKDLEQRLQSAKRIREITQEVNALLIINDDVELAKSVAADGVHLGQDDVDLTQAREQLGNNSVIGISCYNRFDLAEIAVKQGADYVAFGRFFSSQTKPEAVEANIELLHQAKQELSVPVVAIGGITLENAPFLIEAGADMLAVVKGIFAQKDIEIATKQFCALFD